MCPWNLSLVCAKPCQFDNNVLFECKIHLNGWIIGSVFSKNSPTKPCNSYFSGSFTFILPHIAEILATTEHFFWKMFIRMRVICFFTPKLRKNTLKRLLQNQFSWNLIAVCRLSKNKHNSDRQFLQIGPQLWGIEESLWLIEYIGIRKRDLLGAISIVTSLWIQTLIISVQQASQRMPTTMIYLFWDIDCNIQKSEFKLTSAVTTKPYGHAKA
jgi:hypothetical protein